MSLSRVLAQECTAKDKEGCKGAVQTAQAKKRLVTKRTIQHLVVLYCSFLLTGEITLEIRGKKPSSDSKDAQLCLDRHELMQFSAKVASDYGKPKFAGRNRPAVQFIMERYMNGDLVERDSVNTSNSNSINSNTSDSTDLMHEKIMAEEFVDIPQQQSRNSKDPMQLWKRVETMLHTEPGLEEIHANLTPAQMMLFFYVVFGEITK